MQVHTLLIAAGAAAASKPTSATRTHGDRVKDGTPAAGTYTAPTPGTKTSASYEYTSTPAPAQQQQPAPGAVAAATNSKQLLYVQVHV